LPRKSQIQENLPRKSQIYTENMEIMRNLLFTVPSATPRTAKIMTSFNVIFLGVLSASDQNDKFHETDDQALLQEPPRL